MTRILLAIAIVTAAAPARADDTDTPTTFHKGQFGLSTRMGLGVRGIATYHSEYCGVLDGGTNAHVCSGRSPVVLDFEAAYGVAKSIELTVELQIGLEHDFGASAALEGPRPFHLAPGARFFFSEAKHSKLFVQPELVIDFADYKDPAGSSYGKDIGVRGLEGYWYDLHRSVGIYAFVGETAEFSRWLYFGLEFGFGIQGRYP